MTSSLLAAIQPHIQRRNYCTYFKLEMRHYFGEDDIGSPWHLIDPTHVRGFHPLNFDYFIRGRELFQKYGHYYFDFAFREGRVEIEGHNILATLIK